MSSIRVDNRGFTRSVSALRKAFDERIGRRRQGEDPYDLFDEEFIGLIHDVFSNSGWSAALVQTVVCTDDEMIDRFHRLFAHIRATVREQGLLGWVFEMIDEADTAIDSGEPSELMMACLRPGSLNGLRSTEEQQQDIASDAFDEDLFRFSDDALRVGARLLLRWCENDSVAVALARQLLSDDALAAQLCILDELVESVDPGDTLDYLRSRRDELAGLPANAAKTADSSALPSLKALSSPQYVSPESAEAARREQQDDPVWLDIIVQSAPISGDEFDGTVAQFEADDSADVPHHEPDDIPDWTTVFPAHGLFEQFLAQDEQYLYDLRKTLQGYHDIWDMPRDMFNDQTIPKPVSDDPAEFDEYCARCSRALTERRNAWRTRRFPDRADSPWLDLRFLSDRADSLGGIFEFGALLRDSYGDNDIRGFDAAVRTFTAFAATVSRTGLLMLPPVILDTRQEAALQHAGDDIDAQFEHLDWEQRALADFTYVLLRRIPNAALTRSLGITLLDGNIDGYLQQVLELLPEEFRKRLGDPDDDSSEYTQSENDDLDEETAAAIEQMLTAVIGKDELARIDREIDQEAGFGNDGDGTDLGFGRRVAPEYDPDSDHRAFIIRATLRLFDATDPHGNPLQCWREIKIPARCTFLELHDAIQYSFNWLNYHLWDFKLTSHGVRYEIKEPSEDDLDFMPVDSMFASLRESDRFIIADAEATHLGEVFPRTRTAVYSYDYGDGWEHDIRLVKTLRSDAASVPSLLDGEGDAPPEDCGAPWGFAEFLRKIEDPDDPEHQEMIDWGNSQEFRRFDLQKARIRLQSMLE